MGERTSNSPDSGPNSAPLQYTGFPLASINCTFCVHIDANESMNRYCLLQYYFDGPELDIQVKPHGNSKSSTPFFRTSDTARKRHRELACTFGPKETVYQATKIEGGEVEARSLSSLPRNRQQISYYRRNENKRDDNVLYSVMLECKLAQGTQDAFVRDVKAAPEPQCILFLDCQLADMERFLVNDQNYGILTVDPTYNLGQFYVTATTYPHLMLQDVTTQKHPSILGPVLVHQRMDFASFNYFSNTLIGFNKKLRNVRAFGTDGQESLIDSFGHSFPMATQLRCFIHAKKNISEKLKEYGFPTSVAQEIICDIFGKHHGSTYCEGLVDATSVEEFKDRLAKCEEVWNAREIPYAPLGGPRFFDYFHRYKANVVCYNMSRNIRESVGLGSPPDIFTTNASESINALMKRKVDYKESEWPQFNAEIMEIVKQQQDEIIRALSGRGQFRLLPQFSQYSVSATAWTKMRPEQRREVITKFNKATMKSKQPATVAANSDVASSSYRRIAVSPQSSGITKLTITTLQHIWEKAEELMNNDNAITPAPGDDKSARMVLSYSSPVPHLVSKN